MKDNSPIIKKKYTTFNRILWVGAIATSFFLVYFTGYQGDLDYFLNIDDGSARNTLMTLVIIPLSFISNSPQIISYLWLAMVGLFIFRATKQFQFSFFVYIFLVAPFLLLPSKDGLAFIFAMIGLMSNMRIGLILKLIIYILIFILRPFYGLLIFYFFIITHFKKYKLLIYLNILICIIIFSCFYELNNKDLLIKWLEYTTGYFNTATEAGSTDWLFIDAFNPEASILSNSLQIISRAIFPIWMIGIGSMTACAYFFIYVYCIFYSAVILRNGASSSKQKKIPIVRLCYLGLFLVPAAPLLVTNAGSAARYISLLPCICLLLSKEYSRSAQYED